MSQVLEIHHDQFIISTDPARLDINAIVDMLTRAYWAKGRPTERTERAFATSLVFGVYEGRRQIGFARVITDYAIFAYLCDVFIHEDYRGRGLGKWLMDTVLTHPDLLGLRRWMLTTSDAHDLYRRYGFNAPANLDSWMEFIRPFPGESQN
jgi:GNAT superfamily N-acetyltransferase